MENITVVGLGYVGLPVALTFADAGFNVTGFDLDTEKIRKLNEGKCTIEGEDHDSVHGLLNKCLDKTFVASCDPICLHTADAIFVAVQTPFNADMKAPEYENLKKAVEMIGQYIRHGTLVVIESTLAPLTMKNLVIPTLEKTSKYKVGKDIFVGHCPERVAPGKLLYNIFQMSRVLGANDESTHQLMKYYYSKIVINGKLNFTTLTSAEVVKTVENSFRDINIAFSNEIAIACKILGVDINEIVKLVNESPERNMHCAGPGVGGHCIPKDSLLLSYSVGGATPLINVARNINSYMPHFVLQRIKENVKMGDKVAILGYAYKGDTDDCRNSPTEALCILLCNNGIKYEIHDPYVKNECVNDNVYEVIKGASLVVVMTNHTEYIGMDPKDFEALMVEKKIYDTRHIIQAERFKKNGFKVMELSV